MGFAPVSGPAVFRPARPARDSTVELTDGQHAIRLPMRAALPVLTRAHARDDIHPSVALVTGAALLGLRLVAAGRFEPEPGGGGWRPAVLTAAEDQRVDDLARSHGHVDEASARELITQVVAAVVDAVPRRPPVDRPSAVTAPFPPRLQDRLARTPAAAAGGGAAAGGDLVSVSLRVEADEEELVAGAVRLVLQVRDEHDPLHVADAAVLWAASETEHGFGPRARLHATLALRRAADAWPVLDRLLELEVPDQITLDTDELVSLLDHGVAALQGRGVDVLWPRTLGRDLTTRTVLDRAPTPQAQEEPLQTGLFGPDALFAFNWQVALHGEPLTEAEMDQLATAAGPVLKLRDNWMVVDPAVARRAKKRLVRTARPTQALAAALTGVVEVDSRDEQVVVGASLLRVRERLRRNAEHALAAGAGVEQPAGLRGTLRAYQARGLAWLAELTDLGLGGCLADDMGLGKTITLIALQLRRVEAAVAAGGDARPTLVVCPASLLGNWEAEIRRFAPGQDVRRFHGAGRSLEGLRSGFVLTTYGTMRSDTAKDGPGVLGAQEWDLVVADEAQHIKNPASATAVGLRTLRCRSRIALTGTPVENHLTELWAILDWTIPGLLGSRNAFRRAWAAPIEAGVDPARTRQFADLISPFLLRRRKSDPGIAPELPPKTETDHLLRLTREQAVLYEAFTRDTMERIERADEHARRGLVLKLLTGLKQICNHPAHFLRQANPRLAGRSEKLDLVDELLPTVVDEGGAALVFTQYVAMARLLETHLSGLGLRHQLLHGGTPVRQREEMVERFQAGEVPVFLLSLKAGGTGLNLTRADHVVHFDRWWNPAVEEQATDRAHRIGQTRPVQVHRLVTQGTIEERIAELLTRKRALADAVLSRGETALTELGNEELRELVAFRPEADQGPSG